MSMPNSFSTLTPLTALTSSAPSYTVSSTLTSFFPRNLFQKDSKNHKDPQTCFQCSFIKNLVFLCKNRKISPNSNKKTMRTQITEEFFYNDRDFEEKNRDFDEKKANLMEFIDESNEFLSNSKDLQVNSISNSSIFTRNLMRKHPVNELFLYKNEENDQWILTEIWLERKKDYKRGSFEELKKIENIHKEILKKRRNKAISFIFDENLKESSRILDAFKGLEKKNVILDVSSDFSVLKEVFLVFILDFLRILHKNHLFFPLVSKGI